MTARKNEYKDAARFVPWQKSQQNVKLLIVKSTTGALAASATIGTMRLFDFIMDKDTRNNQILCDSTLTMMQGIGSSALPSNDYWSQIRTIIDKGADFNTQGGKYGNLLQTVSYWGSKQVVQIWLNNGADVNAQGGFYGNALQAASARGREEVVRILLDKGADINAQGGLYGNALQAASARGYGVVVQILLDNGACIETQKSFDAAIQAASRYSNDSVVRLLREYKAKKSRRKRKRA